MPSCADFNVSVILILPPPTRRINYAIVDKTSMAITCNCYWYILVTCWLLQLAKRVDRRQSWRKTNLNSWWVRRASDVASFCLTQVAMLYFYRAYRFQKYRKLFVIQQGGVKMIFFSHDITLHPENGRMRLLKSFKKNSHIFEYVRVLDCAGQVYLCILNSV